MKVSIVLDNYVSSQIKKPFRGEHGLSILLEVEGQRILFDTGPSDVVVHNLGLLGVHPREIDRIILSHGHDDHTGGLAAVLALADKKIPVYCHKDVFKARYALADEKYRYVGAPFPEQYLASLGADFNYIEQAVELLPNFWLSGTVPRETAYEKENANLLECQGDCAPGEDKRLLQTDPLKDDMAVYYRGNKGLVIIAGCAHSGIVNIIEHGKKITGEHKIQGIIGGTHLELTSDRQKDATIKAIKACEPEFITLNHCTGFNVMTKFAAIFNEKFIPGFCGTEIEC